MRIVSLTAVIAILLWTGIGTGRAADNELTSEEKAAGWKLLFKGDQKGWKCNTGKPIKKECQVEENALVPLNSGGYLLVYFGDSTDPGKPDHGQFGDFILKCDVKMDLTRKKGCNSGIFIRTGDPNQPVQTGLEMQVSTSVGTNSHQFGGIYDLAAPTKPAPIKKGDWNHVEITCKGPHVSIAVNGETITAMNCDEYTEAGKNPDGRRNKFKTAIKDFPRAGYLGFQDHHDGTKAMYKNIKILELK